ncbi:MAG: Fe-S-containing protein [Bacillota bacterium]|nr:Fe-S-containing protein [Bacillota bacterium]
MSNIEHEAANKKQEFNEKRAKKRKSNRVITFIVILLVFGGIAAFSFANLSTPNKPIMRWDGGNYNIGEEVSYKGQIFGMTDIQLEEIENGVVGFDLATLKSKSLVYADYFYNNGAERVPLLAYISPAGRVVAAISMCEPCQSESFHINGSYIVCDTCRSEWLLNDLNGTRGGCLRYPPEEINYNVVDGKIRILEADLKAWVPRESSGM